jgi:hypothetical protein
MLEFKFLKKDRYKYEFLNLYIYIYIYIKRLHQRDLKYYKYNMGGDEIKEKKISDQN